MNTQEYASIEQMVEVKAFVDDRLEHRTFAEHPEDRIELMHKSSILDRWINKYRHSNGLIILPLPIEVR